MRVLWLCNIMLPFIAKSLGQKIVIKEGWLSGLAGKLMAHQDRNDITLGICFPESESRRFVKEDTSLFVKDKAHIAKSLFLLYGIRQVCHIYFRNRTAKSLYSN